MAVNKDPPTPPQSQCPKEQVPTALPRLTTEIPSPKEEDKTELALWTRNKKRKPETESPAPPLKKKSNTKIGSWLKPSDADAWEIKKTLSSSDLENLLILETEFINDTVLPSLGDTLSKRVLNSKYGAKVTVHDRDFFSKHKIVLKQCGSSTKNFAFDEDWQKEFVKRRELKEGDEIVIGWYMPSNVPSKAMFTFKVNRAKTTAVDQDKDQHS